MRWPEMPAPRLLAIRLDNAGDVLLLEPALRALKAANPHTHITLLASPAGAQAAPLVPQVDEVIVHRAAWQQLDATQAAPDAEEALIAELRSRAFDAAFIFTSFSQSPYGPAFAAFLARIPERVGQAPDFGGALLTTAVPQARREGHECERSLHLLRSAGIPVDDAEVRLRVPPADAEAAGRLLARAGIGGPFVVVAPGASCASRRYPAAGFARAATLVHRATRTPVVLVGHAGERAIEVEFLTAAPDLRCTSLVGETTLAVLGAIVQRAALVLANNSAPMHLAEGLRRPVVVTYAGTDLQSQWAPRSTAARILARPVACSPCYRFACPTDLECLDIDPREVADAAVELLAPALATPAPVGTSL